MRFFLNTTDSFQYIIFIICAEHPGRKTIYVKYVFRDSVRISNIYHKC